MALTQLSAFFRPPPGVIGVGKLLAVDNNISYFHLCISDDDDCDKDADYSAHNNGNLVVFTAGKRARKLHNSLAGRTG